MKGTVEKGHRWGKIAQSVERELMKAICVQFIGYAVFIVWQLKNIIYGSIYVVHLDFIFFI